MCHPKALLYAWPWHKCQRNSGYWLNSVCVRASQLPLCILEDQILTDGSLKWKTAYGYLEAGLKPHWNSGSRKPLMQWSSHTLVWIYTHGPASVVLCTHRTVCNSLFPFLERFCIQYLYILLWEFWNACTRFECYLKGQYHLFFTAVRTVISEYLLVCITEIGKNFSLKDFFHILGITPLSCRE